MRYCLQRHDGTDCSATMVPITVLRMVPIQRYRHIMLRVIDVDYLKDYELLVTFNDGNRKKVDLKPYLTGEVFGELLDTIWINTHHHRMGKWSRFGSGIPL